MGFGVYLTGDGPGPAHTHHHNVRSTGKVCSDRDGAFGAIECPHRSAHTEPAIGTGDSVLGARSLPDPSSNPTPATKAMCTAKAYSGSLTVRPRNSTDGANVSATSQLPDLAIHSEGTPALRARDLWRGQISPQKTGEIYSLSRGLTLQCP